MSAAAGRTKGSAGAMLPLVAVALFAVCGAAWFVLVMREDDAAAAATARANALEEEIGKANAYMRMRATDEKAKEGSREASELLQKRLPVGRKDLAVVQYFQLRAADAGIPDFKYEVVGGMQLPSEQNEKEKPPQERLAFDPARLQGQQLQLDFTARYAEFLKFQKAVAEAPWMLEVVSADLKRDKDNTVKAHVVLRYLYQ